MYHIKSIQNSGNIVMSVPKSVENNTQDVLL